MSTTRREFIKVTAGGVIIAALNPRFLFGQQGWAGTDKFGWVLLPGAAVPNGCSVRTFDSKEIDSRFPELNRVRVIRPTDLFDLTFEWVNMKTGGDDDENPVLQKKSGRSFLVVLFPPQHVLEEAFKHKDRPTLPVGAILGGSTRLVFEIPETYEAKALSYDLETLLGWSRFRPSLAPNALPPDYRVTARETPRPLTSVETAIELPWGMLLSPDSEESWRHSVDPQRTNPTEKKGKPERFALWATELVRENSVQPVSVRAVWCNEANPDLWTVSPAEITNFANWYARLTAVSPPPAIAFIVQQLPKELVELLKPGSGIPENRLRLDFTIALNRLVSGLSFYDAGRFTGVTLSTESQELIGKSPLSVDESLRLNRLLLSDLFPPPELGKPRSPLWPLPPETQLEPYRRQLVDETANFNLTYRDHHRYLPKHVDVRNLLLSSQGAYAKLRAAWTVDELNGFPAQTVDEWEQETIWGRDQYAKLSILGYCMPFGHAVSYVEIRRRELVEEATNGSGTVAVIKRRFYFAVREPVLEYVRPADGTQGVGRDFCFKRVELTPSVTPFVAERRLTGDWMVLESAVDYANPKPEEIFKFKVVADDWDGNRHEFEIPLYWVRQVLAESGQDAPEATDLTAKVTKYDAQPARRVAILSGRKIAFSPSGSTAEQDGAIETGAISFHVRTPPPWGWRHLFYPRVEWSKVRLAQTAPFDRGEGGPTQGARFVYHPVYVDEGFGQKNINEVVANIYNAGMNFPGGKSGGLCTPSINVAAFSRKFGPVGGPVQSDPIGPSGSLMVMTAAASSSQFVQGKFDPAEFLGEAAKLVGGIDLKEVIETVDKAYEELARVPKLIAQTIDEIKSDVAKVRQTVEQISALIDQLSSFGTKEFAALKKELRDKILFAVSSEIASAREKIVEQLLAEVPDLEGIRDGMADRIRACLAGVVPVAKLEAAVTATVTAFAGDGMGKILEVVRSRASFEHFVRDTFATTAAELEQGAEAERNRRIARLLDYVQSPEFGRLLGVNRVRANADALARDVLEKLAVVLETTAGKDVRLAVYHPDVVAQLLVAWHDPAAIGPMVKTKIDEALRDVTSAERKRLKDSVDVYFRDNDAEIRQTLARWNTALGQFRDHVMVAVTEWAQAVQPDGQLLAEQIAIVAETLNPHRIREGFDAAARSVDDIVGTLRDMPGSLLASVSVELKKVLVDLGDPLKLTGGATQTLRQLKVAIETLGRAEAGKVTAEGVKHALVSAIAQAAQRLQSSVTNAFESQIRIAFDGLAASWSKSVLPPAIKKEVTDNLDALNAQYREQLVGARDSCGKKLQDLANGWLEAGKIEALLGPVPDALAKIFQAVLDALNAFEELEAAITEAIPKEIAYDYSWEPRLRSSRAFEASRNGKPATFVLKTRVRQSVSLTRAPKPPSIRVEGRLTDFALHLLPSTRFVTVVFREMSFVSIDGNSPHVEVKIDRVVFGEALKFVQELAKALSPDSGFFIQLSGDGVEAGYRFALPEIASGGFNLIQVSISCSVVLPFDGGPVRARFALCERNRPFLLSVGPYGGGGFLAITLNAGRVEKLEGSFEFGAIVALNIGVAHGVVAVTGGIYFCQEGNNASLYGFVRAVGSLRVIGLITITAQFYLGVGYEKRGSRTLAVGEAIITVEIEIGFFSVSVDLHYRKELEGSSDDHSESAAQAAKFAPMAFDVARDSTPAPLLSRKEAYGLHQRNWKYYRSCHYHAAN